MCSCFLYWHAFSFSCLDFWVGLSWIHVKTWKSGWKNKFFNLDVIISFLDESCWIYVNSLQFVFLYCHAILYFWLFKFDCFEFMWTLWSLDECVNFSPAFYIGIHFHVDVLILFFFYGLFDVPMLQMVLCLLMILLSLIWRFIYLCLSLCFSYLLFHFQLIL